MITVFGGTPQFGLADFSPACLKLKTYLRMRDIPYEKKQGNPRGAPTKKIPYVKFDDGLVVGDSQLIFEEIHRRHGNPLDESLTKEQHALGLMVRRAVEEHLYWVTMLSRWQDDASYAHMKTAFADMMPPVIGGLILRAIRKSALQSTWGHGIGRHTRASVDAMGRADLDAIEVLIGQKPFLFGDAPTTYDAALYGQLANAIHFPIETAMIAYAKNKPTLHAYCDRITEQYFASP